MPAHRVAQPVQPSRPTSTGILARRPVIGLVLLIIGAAVFSILAVNVRTNGPLLAWDMPIDQALHTYAEHDWRADFYAMRFAGTLGRETALGITILLSLYWLWKRYWREASMLIIGAF